jgi:cyclophilin family peptidyl-prolyl cis-trans isomerase
MLDRWLSSIQHPASSIQRLGIAMKKLAASFLLMVFLASVARQMPTASGQPAAAGAGATEAQAKAEFDRRFADYTAALRTIEQLRTEYQTADAAGREQINRRLADEVTTAKERLDAMLAAAMDSYRAAPNADPQVTALLVAVARHYAVGEVIPRSDGIVNGGDNYEQALPIIERLVDGGAAEKRLPVWGFVSAFVTNDYELADKYLQQAKDAGGLVDPRSIDDAAERGVMVLAVQYAVALDEYRDLWAKEQAIRAAEAAADDLPRVKLTTSKGDLVVELFENEAPQAVANFITLVKQGFYDGVTFHRVLGCFMAQGGDPEGTGSGGPGYAIRCECYQPNFRHHFRGSLSMAHAGRDTGGSQFFLTFVPTTHLDGKHTVFGRVIDGIEVLGELQKRSPTGNPTSDAALPAPDRILKAEVLRDRGHEYAFEKLPAQ